MTPFIDVRPMIKVIGSDINFIR
jgi:hypothetical protein